MSSDSPKVGNSGMFFASSNIGERAAGSNRPGINSSGAMINKKPVGSFSTNVNNYNQQVQATAS